MESVNKSKILANIAATFESEKIKIVAYQVNQTNTDIEFYIKGEVENGESRRSN